MLGRAIAWLVEASTRAAWAVVMTCLISGILLGTYAATHLSVDTDTTT